MVWLVSAVVALALVGALALLLGRSASDDDGTTSASSTATAGGSTTPESTGPTESDSASPTSQPSETGTAAPADATTLRRCAAEVSRAAGVVSAAAPGVSDWTSHVGARTDMLSGRLSVDAMDAIWKRTRLAGPADQKRFKTARSDYHSTSHCAHLGDGSGSGPAAACAAGSKAATRAVAAADAVMRDWESHIANMAMYAHHEMSSVTAQDRWVSAWRNAPKHIEAYRSARAALDDAPACKVAG